MKMSENEKLKQVKQVCKLGWREDSVTGWKLKIEDLTPECRRSLENASKNLGPHSKNYLARRIETDNPEVKKILKEIGLSPR